ncbi:MAG: hypothetical protein IJT58_03220 [Synergistaceae bacterium]|nr:hypothetical protein [Synergistaceae bacterium]
MDSQRLKTPHVAVSDNTPEKLKNVDKSKLFHIYSDESVKDNLTNSQPPEALLPDLVRNAYMLLASDWKDTFDRWRESGKNVPPVMIKELELREKADTVGQEGRPGEQLSNIISRLGR